MTYISVSKVTIIVSDNGLSPGRCQAIIRNNAGILLIGPLGTNFTGILFEIHTFSFKKMLLKLSSAKMAAILSRPQCVKWWSHKMFVKWVPVVLHGAPLYFYPVDLSHNMTLTHCNHNPLVYTAIYLIQIHKWVCVLSVNFYANWCSNEILCWFNHDNNIKFSSFEWTNTKEPIIQFV